MDIITGIETRHSTRDFTNTPVPRELIEKILDCARHSPSATNSQPWQAAVVCGEKRDELSQLILEMAEENKPPRSDIPRTVKCPAEIAERIENFMASRYRYLGMENADEEQKRNFRLQNYKFYGAPCVIYLFMEKSISPMSLFDLGAFAQTLVLAAHAYGLGTCLQGSISGYADTVRKFLNMPEGKQLVIGIALGYADREALINSFKSDRIAIEKFVQWHS